MANESLLIAEFNYKLNISHLMALHSCATLWNDSNSIMVWLITSTETLQHVENDSDTFSNSMLFIWILISYAFQHSTFNTQHTWHNTNNECSNFDSAIIVGALPMICFVNANLFNHRWELDIHEDHDSGLLDYYHLKFKRHLPVVFEGVPGLKV